MREDDAGLLRRFAGCGVFLSHTSFPTGLSAGGFSCFPDGPHIAYHHNLPIITVWPNTRPNITSRPTAAHGMQSWPRSSSGILETS